MLNTTEKFFKIFADKNRLRILKLLQQRKMCVCELAFVLQVTQPSISRHLRKMKESGLVGDEQDGFWTNYFLKENSKAGAGIIQWIKFFLKNDKVIRADMDRLKKVDRTKLCCK
ncbi:MAG: metalloregulator ArsR/SmtB family transcription factor [Candidatus Omnitrophica bacterium]|nr:metalloregulator ArsR/SmtB family transcription factor [Candidatus Omnitrophota bacterium]